MDKLKLFEMTFKKVSADKSFIAWHLEQISHIENHDRETILTSLQCPSENFYKLALCKAPDINAGDFKQRLDKIADYAGVNAEYLRYVFVQVNTYQSIEASLEKKTLEHVVFAKLKQSQHGFVKGMLTVYRKIDVVANPETIYRSGIAAILLLLTFFMTTAKVDERAVYATHTGNYRDSLKTLALADHTAIKKSSFKNHISQAI